MGTIKDINGQKFGKLTAVKYLYVKNGHAIWLCKCDCGNFTKVASNDLLKGGTKSCGCLQKESHTKHGKYKERLYNIYRGIKQRCYNHNRKRYKDYGGRGIKMCDEWLNDFMMFYDWSMANGYDDTLTIDRIDNDGNYEPNNCRWVTPKQQVRNQRSNRNITINNETHCLSEWCEILGLKYSEIWKRINRFNWTIKQALELEER